MRARRDANFMAGMQYGGGEDGERERGRRKDRLGKTFPPETPRPKYSCRTRASQHRVYCLPPPNGTSDQVGKEAIWILDHRTRPTR